MKDQYDNSPAWFAARCLFYDLDNKCYEERTVLVKATSHDEAIAKAEQDATNYAKSIGNMKYLNYVDTFHLFEKEFTDGTEIFSLIRHIDLNRDKYIDRFLDSGYENRSDNAK